MNAKETEDIRDAAVKLAKIYSDYPEDYFYLKGWIHCLLQKEKEEKQTLCKPV